MPPFMHQAQEMNQVLLYFVVDIIGKRLCSPAGEAMWADVVSASPFDDFTRLSGNPFVERAGEPF